MRRKRSSLSFLTVNSDLWHSLDSPYPSPTASVSLCGDTHPPKKEDENPDIELQSAANTAAAIYQTMCIAAKEINSREVHIEASSRPRPTIVTDFIRTASISSPQIHAFKKMDSSISMISIGDLSEFSPTACPSKIGWASQPNNSGTQDESTVGKVSTVQQGSVEEQPLVLSRCVSDLINGLTSPSNVPTPSTSGPTCSYRVEGHVPNCGGFGPYGPYNPAPVCMRSASEIENSALVSTIAPSEEIDIFAGRKVRMVKGKHEGKAAFVQRKVKKKYRVQVEGVPYGLEFFPSAFVLEESEVY